MAIEQRMVHFRSDDTGEVIAEMDRIEARGDGKEWITLAPWVDPENLPMTSLLRRMFTAKGPSVPEVTWVAAHSGEPAQLGVVHATGSNADARVAEAGVSVPAEWVLLGDHTKRGLLYAVPPGTSAATVLEIALGFARSLALVPTDNRWVVGVSSSTR